MRCCGSTPEASLTSSRNALNCHVDPLRLSPATSTRKSFAFVDAAHFVEPTFLSSRGASRVTFIEVWRCFFFRSTCLFALRSAASSPRSFPSSALSLRSFASSASSTFGSCAFASVAARHRPTFSRSDAISASRFVTSAVLAVATRSSVARSAAACVPGVGCGVLGIVGCARRGRAAGRRRRRPRPGPCVVNSRKVAQELLSSAPKAVASSSQHRVAHLFVRGRGRIAAPPCGRGILLVMGNAQGSPMLPRARVPLCEQFFLDLLESLSR